MQVPVMVLGTVQAASRPFALYVDGFDVLVRLGTGQGVLLESIVVTENGPGGVSQLDFVYEDPIGSNGLPQAGADIQFWDRTNNVPLFRGFLNNYAVTPFPAATGRTIAMSADGIEILLDWRVRSQETFSPRYTFSTNILAYTADVISRLASSYTNLYASWGGDTVPPTGTVNGSAGQPVGLLGPVASTVAIQTYAVYLFASPPTLSGSLRDMMRQVVAASDWESANGIRSPAPYDVNITVDFYGRLRAWAAGQQPDDYTTLTVSDTVGGAIAAANFQYEVHPADIIHEVYIQGGNAAGSGWFGDGSGIQGQQAIINDSTITDATRAQNTATAYLVNQAASVRGSFDIETFTPATTVHAGGLVTITDTQSGLTAQTFVVGQIRKTFVGNGKHNWTVIFGGLPPSAMDELRRLTRAVIN